MNYRWSIIHRRIFDYKGNSIMTYNISRNARIKLPEVWGSDRLVECDFSLQELIDDYINNTDTNNSFYDNLHCTRYFRHLASFFRMSSIHQKNGESVEQFLTRLFYQAYYKKGFAFCNGRAARRATGETTTRTRAPRNIRDNEELQEQLSVLSELGLEVTRCNNKYARIVFKHSGKEYRISTDELIKLSNSLDKKHDFSHERNFTRIGVEIEFFGNIRKRNAFCEAMKKLVGENQLEVTDRYQHNDGQQWVLGRDGSLHRSPNMCQLTQGFELTSPILMLNNEQDIEMLEKVIELIKTEFEGTVNKTCGLHVHLSVPYMHPSYDLKKYLAHAYKVNEPICFDKVVERRRVNSRWARSCSPEDTFSRYRKLNLCHMNAADEQLHLEFRQLEGTLDFGKIYAWIKILKTFTDVMLDTYKKTNEQHMTESVNSDGENNNPVAISPLNYTEYTIPEMNIEDIIMDLEFTEDNIENLLVMSKKAKAV